MKPKGVTTQMKALDEYFLMVVSGHVVAKQSSCFGKIYFNLGIRETWQ